MLNTKLPKLVLLHSVTLNISKQIQPLLGQGLGCSLTTTIAQLKPSLRHRGDQKPDLPVVLEALARDTQLD